MMVTILVKKSYQKEATPMKAKLERKAQPQSIRKKEAM
jgi:hypothetical protein